ncbi:MAG: DUF4339 domain-containing protein [Granulicella sp.]
MTYKIARDGQEFGPYSLADVQRYVGTGNILLTDFALAEGATEWIPVARVVGTIAVQPAALPAGYAAGAMPQFPEAPNLNWGLVLLLDFVTCGLFNIAWNFVQALWMKKVQPESKAMQWYIVILVIAALNILVSVVRVVTLMGNKGVEHGFTPLLGLTAFFGLASLILNWFVYPFVMRSSLLKHFNETDPIGLQLNGVMTFFFTSLYFQYHLNHINEMKRAYRPGNPY